jgi:hypothetical protein
MGNRVRMRMVEAGVKGVVAPAVRGAVVTLVDHGVVEPVGLLEALLGPAAQDARGPLQSPQLPHGALRGVELGLAPRGEAGLLRDLGARRRTCASHKERY